MKRYKSSGRKDKRIFRHTAVKTKKMNVQAVQARGGTRL